MESSNTDKSIDEYKEIAAAFLKEVEENMGGDDWEELVNTEVQKVWSRKADVPIIKKEVNFPSSSEDVFKWVGDF